MNNITLSENEIHIYKSLLIKSPSEISEYNKILSSDEKERAGRFKFEKHRNRFIAGRGLLRQILSRYLKIHPSEIKFSYEEKGKPFLKDNRIRFNLAHSNEFAVYAIMMDNEVGIDLEFKKEMTDALEIGKRFFSAGEFEELKNLKGSDIETGFFNCWTRKEAFIKAIGEGLSYPLSDFSVTLKPGVEPEFLWIKKNPEEVKEWSLHNIEINNDYISALAVKLKNAELFYKSI